MIIIGKCGFTKLGRHKRGVLFLQGYRWYKFIQDYRKGDERNGEPTKTEKTVL